MKNKELNDLEVAAQELKMKRIEVFKAFKNSQDFDSLTDLERVMTQSSELNESSNEEHRNFIVKVYNFLRSPEFDQTSQLFLRALSVCIKAGVLMKSRDELDNRTLAFLCRKISWILLKNEKYDSEDLKLAMYLGKECLVSLLKMSETHVPGIGARKEMKECMFEVEACRALATLYTGDVEAGLDSLKTLSEDIRSATFNTATNICSLLFKFTQEPKVVKQKSMQNESLSSPSGSKEMTQISQNINWKLEALKAGYDVIEMTHLNKNDWAGEIFLLVEELLKAGEKREAEEIYLTIENEKNPEDPCYSLIMQLMIRCFAVNPSARENDSSLSIDDEILVSSIENAINRTLHFELYFHIWIKYMPQKAEAVIKSMLKQFHGQNADEERLGVKATELFINECVATEKPVLIMGVFSSGVVKLEWCTEHVVRQLWSFADQLRMKQSETVEILGDAVDTNNNSQSKSLCLDLLQLAAKLASNNCMCEMDDLDKAQLLRQLANMMMLECRYDDVEQTLEKAFDLDQTNPFLYYLIFLKSLHQKSKQKVDACIQAILSSSYLNCETRYKILVDCAYKCFDENDAETGTEILDITLQHCNLDDPSKTMHLYLVLAEKGKFEQETDCVANFTNCHNFLDENKDATGKYCEQILRLCWNKAISASEGINAFNLWTVCLSFCKMQQEVLSKSSTPNVLLKTTEQNFSNHQIITMTLKCVAQVLQFGLISHRAGTELNLSDLCEESVREFFQVLKHFDVTMHVAECENQVSESSIDDDAKEIENFNQSGTTEAITVCPINQHDANQDYVTENSTPMDTSQDHKKLREEINSIAAIVFASYVENLIYLKVERKIVKDKLEQIIMNCSKITWVDTTGILRRMAAKAYLLENDYVEFLCRNLLVRNRTSHVNVSKMHQDDKIEEVENFLHDVIRLLKLSDGTQNNLESTEDENQGRLSLLPRFKMVIKETEKTVSSFSLTEDLSVNDDVNAEDEFPKWIDQLEWIIVRTWSYGMELLQKRHRVEALGICNSLISLTAPFTKVSRLSAYHKKMRDRYSQFMLRNRKRPQVESAKSVESDAEYSPAKRGKEAIE